MPLFDLPLPHLETYLPERHEPLDFDDFWAETLGEARRHPIDVTLEPHDTGLPLFETHDLSFRGYGGHTVRGWFITPRDAEEPLPCVVQFIGYGGGRGRPHDWLLWPSAGYATLVMDTRGQGSAWRRGDTPDPSGTEPHYPGFMTTGILSPHTYYYRRLITDAVRAVDAAHALERVDPAQIVVTGGSQGGGLALAVAGLRDDLACTMPDVPFLCHFERAITLVDTMPYAEIARFLAVHRDRHDDVLRTLSYVDGVNFAARASAPALFSVALMDTVCPPSTVFAAYNHYAGPKELRVWPYNNHEGGQTDQQIEQIRFLGRMRRP